MTDNVKFVERVPQFEAQRFDYENPTAIIAWVREKRSDAVVVFDFPKDLEAELGPENDMTRYLRVGPFFASGNEEIVAVPQDHWLIFSWPNGRDRRKWVVMDDDMFDRHFREAKSDD